MTKEQIKNIPRDQVITCAHIVMDFCSWEADPNRVHLTASRSNCISKWINYPNSWHQIAKILWNSMLSIPNNKYSGVVFTLVPHLISVNICKSLLNFFLNKFLNSTINRSMKSMAMSMLKSWKLYMDYHKIISLPTSCWTKSCTTWLCSSSMEL